jgi:hypothetical protein
MSASVPDVKLLQPLTTAKAKSQSSTQNLFRNLSWTNTRSRPKMMTRTKKAISIPKIMCVALLILSADLRTMTQQAGGVLYGSMTGASLFKVTLGCMLPVSRLEAEAPLLF